LQTKSFDICGGNGIIVAKMRKSFGIKSRQFQLCLFFVWGTSFVSSSATSAMNDNYYELFFTISHITIFQKPNIIRINVYLEMKTEN
jgi:hypothetical protein